MRVVDEAAHISCHPFVEPGAIGHLRKVRNQRKAGSETEVFCGDISENTVFTRVACRGGSEELCPVLTKGLFGGARYIADCIGSVKVERPGLVEHLIVDNCSDDETSTVLATNPHVRAIVEKDKWQSDGFNRGISLADGDWILWLNADDYMLPGTVERFVEMLGKDPSADVIYSHTHYVEESGAEIRSLYQVKWEYYMIQYGLVVLPTSGTLFRTPLPSGWRRGTPGSAKQFPSNFFSHAPKGLRFSIN